jgi:hypothetical protein
MLSQLLHLQEQKQGTRVPSSFTKKTASLCSEWLSHHKQTTEERSQKPVQGATHEGKKSSQKLSISGVERVEVVEGDSGDSLKMQGYSELSQ